MVSFNPLFIGSKDATGVGSWAALQLAMRFQSPFHRVKGCNSGSSPSSPRGELPRFNPLFIGSKDATPALVQGDALEMLRFNPLFIGSKDATNLARMPFPPDSVGVSIPFSSGQRMQLPGLAVVGDLH